MMYENTLLVLIAAMHLPLGRGVVHASGPEDDLASEAALIERNAAAARSLSEDSFLETKTATQ